MTSPSCVRRLGHLGTPVLGTAVLRPSGGSVPRKAKAQASAQVSYSGHPGRAEAEPDAVFADYSASGPAVWTPGTPKVTGDVQDYPQAAAPRRLNETRPMPRASAADPGRYPGSADPASGD